MGAGLYTASENLLCLLQLHSASCRHTYWLQDSNALRQQFAEVILCTVMSPSGLQVCSWLYRLQQGGLHSILAGIGKVRWQQGLGGLKCSLLSQSIS